MGSLNKRGMEFSVGTLIAIILVILVGTVVFFLIKKVDDAQEITVDLFIGGSKGIAGFQSLEISGDDDNNNQKADPESGKIRKFCPGIIGVDCHSRDNDCDDVFGEWSEKYKNEKGCFIMASEEDNAKDVKGDSMGDSKTNDCGIAKAAQGTIIKPHPDYLNFLSDGLLIEIKSDGSDNINKKIDYDRIDASHLFQWSWASTVEDGGSYLCAPFLGEGFQWVRCGGSEESIESDGITYTCKNGEWE